MSRILKFTNKQFLLEQQQLHNKKSMQIFEGICCRRTIS